MNREYHESKLFLPLKEFFLSRGYEVAAEVPVPYWFACCDLVAVKWRKFVVAVEMKTSLTKDVIKQAYRARPYAHIAFAAVPTNPRSLDYAKELGVGVLRVSDSGVKMILAPKMEKIDSARNTLSAGYPDFREMALDLSTDNDSIGGLPSFIDAPQRGCRMRVNEYLLRHPEATWKEIFENVENHYSSPSSMASAIGAK